MKDTHYIPQKPQVIKKKTRKPETDVIDVKAEPTADIPQDLQDVWASVVALSTCHHLFQEGAFPFRFNNAIGVSLKYLEALHAQALKAASEHPQSHLIPEIKVAVDRKVATDGKTNSDN